MIRLVSGKWFDPMNALPEDIHIEDIAHALSNQCRWGGHTDPFYSVAQHSSIIAGLASAEHALWGLLHDAAEAYLVDLPRPLKKLVPEYVAAEARLMRVICARFRLPMEQPEEIGRLDQALLQTEAIQLMGGPLPDMPEMAPVTIEPVGPRSARSVFLLRFRHITAKMG